MQESKEESNTNIVNAEPANVEWITVGVCACVGRHQTTEIALTDVQVWARAYTVALWFDIQTSSTPITCSIN